MLRGWCEYCREDFVIFLEIVYLIYRNCFCCSGNWLVRFFCVVGVMEDGFLFFWDLGVWIFDVKVNNIRFIIS